MRKLVSSLLALFTSFFMGVSPVEPPNKVYTPESFYVGVTQEDPDYRLINSVYNATTVVSKEKCSKAAKPLLPGYKPFKPDNENNFIWLWALKTTAYDTNGDKVMDKPIGFLKAFSAKNTEGYTKVTVNGESSYMWKLANGVRLTAFANTYLSANEQSLVDPYPKDGYSKGVNMSLIYKDLQGGKAYRVTYMSMKRWWCDLDKNAKGDSLKDGDATKPLFGHDITFTDSDTFYAGSVIGESGSTGVQPADGVVLIAQFSVCDITDGQPTKDWKTVSVEEFYKKPN